MSDAIEDPTISIKLFGKTIPLPEIQDVIGDFAGAPPSSFEDIVDHSIHQNHASSSSSAISSLDSKTNNGDGEEQEEIEKDILGEGPLDGAPTESSEELRNPDATSRTSEDSLMTTIEKEATTLTTSKTEEQGEKHISQEKTLTKPDKVLPCARCNSMETKFCYYNNYNVKQPRHFCKNCQRYWTAGGAIRNMPFGAGRRKNNTKFTPHFRQLVSEARKVNHKHLPNEVHHPSLESNGPVPATGSESDTPLVESMTYNWTGNGFCKPQEIRLPFPCPSEEKENDHLNGSSVISAKLMEEARVRWCQEQVMKNCQSIPPQVPSFPGSPWPFPWNPVPWISLVPLPAFCPPGFSMPFYPTTAYGGCTISGALDTPSLVQPSSPTLGKHSREGNMLNSNDPRDEYGHSKENTKEKCLWVPKTLRIDDPREAAKSSILTTLGINNDKVNSFHKGGGLFKAYQPNGDEKNNSAQTSPILQANPAALARSLNFHETS